MRRYSVYSLYWYKSTNTEAAGGAQLSAALADAAADGQRAHELEAELARVRADRQRICDELKVSRAAVEGERVQRMLAVETAVSEVRQAAETEVGALRGELLHAQRENGKHVVELRQMERQLAAVHISLSLPRSLARSLPLSFSLSLYICIYIHTILIQHFLNASTPPSSTYRRRSGRTRTIACGCSC